MKKVIKFFSLFALILSCTACSNNNEKNVNESEKRDAIEQTKVSLNAGTLIGYRENDVNIFKGIPYAKTERFQNPEPIQKFESSPQMALTYGAVSPQNVTKSQSSPSPYEFITPTNGTSDMVSNESVQYLNVWSNNSKNKKPVVVFFHGGGLVSGASSELSVYDGEKIAADQNLVFVSVNHRLNALGFLDLSNYGDEYAESGILGIKDCITALNWVQENIEKFGGDPSNVTIIGQSGGAEKVSTLASMPETEGLFDKVVYMSGYYATQPKEVGEENTEKLRQYMGVDSNQFVDRLKEMSYDELIDLADKAGCNWDLYYGIGGFQQPFIDDSGKVNESAAKRTWIIGTTYSEFNTNVMSLITDGEQSLNYLPNVNEDEVRKELSNRYGTLTEDVITEFEKSYPDKKLAELLYLNPLESNGFSRYELINSKNGLLKLLNDNNVTVYNYIMTYTMPYFGGVTMYHSGDLGFWFNNLDKISYMIAGDEETAQTLSDTMSATLGAFARNSNPSTSSVTWDAYTKDKKNTMVFDTNITQKSEFDLKLYNLIMK